MNGSVQDLTKETIDKRRREGFSKWDWILLIVLSLFCFLSFQQADILHTAGSSVAYLNGRFWDFYEYNAAYVEGNAYMPTTYLLYAVWMIPIRVFGILKVPFAGDVAFPVLMWYKLFPTLFFLAGAFVMYRICQTLNMGEGKSKLAMYLFLTTPTAFFSQYIFGQYDSITLLFVMLGIYFWLRDRRLPFALFFGLAITCKYFSLLLFLPMLLLREKNYLKILKTCGLAVLPFAAETLFYMHDAYFINGVFGFSSVGYITNVGFSNGYANLSLVIFAWIAVCVLAYLKNPKDADEEFRWFVFGGNVVVFLIFGLSMWHPQWLMFATPFFVFGLFTAKKYDLAVIMDLLLMVCFVGFTVNFWANHVDQRLLERGIWKWLIDGRFENGIMMRDIFLVKDVSLWYSAFSALLFSRLLLLFPKKAGESEEPAPEPHWVGWARTRFCVGVAIFVLPAMLCMGSMILSPNLILNANNGAKEAMEPMLAEVIEQEYTPAQDVTLEKIGIFPGTYYQNLRGTLTVSVRSQSGEVLSDTTVSLSKLKNCATSYVKIPSAGLTANQTYRIVFSIQAQNYGTPVTLFYEPEGVYAGLGTLYRGGEPAEGTLCLELLGE